MSLGIWLQCPCCGKTVWEASPTYNLGGMWSEAGANLHEYEGKTGEEILPELYAAVARMEREPERFKAMNPQNGWGDYDGLLEVMRGLLFAARQHSNFKIGLSR